MTPLEVGSMWVLMPRLEMAALAVCAGSPQANEVHRMNPASNKSAPALVKDTRAASAHLPKAPFMGRNFVPVAFTPRRR